MYGLLVCAMMVAPVQDPGTTTRPTDRDPGSPTSLDGNWTVLSVEKEGKAMPEVRNATCNIANNMVTCKADAKHDMKTMRLEFGPNATIRVTEVNDRGTVEKTKVGVYVLNNDFLAICLHDTPAGTVSGRNEGERTSLKVDGPFTAKPNIKSDCTIFLRRADRTTDR